MLWTLDDTQFLLDNYHSFGLNKCAEILNKTKGSVKCKASRLGLKSSSTKSAIAKESYLKYLIVETKFELLEPYILSNVKVLHKHLICGHIWKVSPNNIRKGQGCPGCGKAAKLSNQQYVNRISYTNFRALSPYSGSETKILHKHILCEHEWLVRPHDILQGQNCPKCSKNNYSKVAINWLNSFNNKDILHAENGGEYSIAGLKVDGYDPKMNTAYEFHGDVYHGNLEIFNENDFCHPFNKTITAGELWENTFNKMLKVSKEASVIYIWEKEYRDGKTFSRF
jgi:hypothetical protein